MWVEAFKDFLHHFIGVCIIPLFYVIRESVATSDPVPPLVTNQPHLTEHILMKNDFVARGIHTLSIGNDNKT